LKSWLDNVIVPTLVTELIREMQLKNGIAPKITVGIESSRKPFPSSEDNS
jgi:hypothetical protein